MVCTTLFFILLLAMNHQDLRFNKNERLKKIESFKTLIKNGYSINKYPIRCILYLIPFDGESNIKVAFNVPKRKFKSAVVRNKIKRQMREVYRLNRNQLKVNLTSQDKTCYMLIHYTGSDIVNFNRIEKSIQYILNSIEVS